MNQLMRLASLAVVALFGTVAAQAADPVPTPRVDIYGQNVKLKPGKASDGAVINNIGWGDEAKRPTSLTSEFRKVKAGEWNTFTVSFIPETDGQVTLTLMGSWSRGKDKKDIDQQWVYFDSVSAQGATIKNGEFDELTPEGMPVGWSLLSKKLANGGEGLLAGKKAVAVWHNGRCTQSIAVKAGQEVTLTFVVMPDEFVAGKQ